MSANHLQVKEAECKSMPAMVWGRACWKGVEGAAVRDVGRWVQSLGPEILGERHVMEHRSKVLEQDPAHAPCEHMLLRSADVSGSILYALAC